MSWIINEYAESLLMLSGIFYGILCIFSIVTGMIYMSGKRELNPIELSEKFLEKINDPEALEKFTKRMGLVTIIVGIVQGVACYALLQGDRPVFYWIAMGFTIFSICSVVFKLRGKVSAFPLIKLAFYVLILIVLMLDSTKAVFFVH